MSAVHARLAAPLLALAVLALAPRAEARCAPPSLRQEVERSAFVVEAVLVRAGESAEFRVETVWKGDAAPAVVHLGARQGRGRWPWAEAANEGRRYLLFLQPAGAGFTVDRCGATAEVSEPDLAAIRALGLTPRPRRDR